MKWQIENYLADGTRLDGKIPVTANYKEVAYKVHEIYLKVKGVKRNETGLEPR